MKGLKAPTKEISGKVYDLTLRPGEAVTVYMHGHRHATAELTVDYQGVPRIIVSERDMDTIVSAEKELTRLEAREKKLDQRNAKRRAKP